MSRVTALVAACCLLVGPASGPAVAEDTEFTVHVSYDEFEEEVRPRPGRRFAHEKIAFTPLEDDRLRVVLVRTHPSRIRSDASEVVLGAKGEGPRANVQWFRRDGETYTRVQTTSTFVMIVTARVQGRACAAEVRFDLRPGFREYQRVRARDLTEKVFLKTLRADNVKCWIGDYLVS